jgi:hypothetical protein
MAEKEITLRDLFFQLRSMILFLLAKWKWIVLGGGIGLAAGLAYALLKPPEYVAKISFVTDTGTDLPSGFSMYAGLAAQFGMDIGQSSSNGLFSGDNIFDLMKTRRMLENTLMTPVTINGKPTLLINRYIEIENLKDKWRNKPYANGLSFTRSSDSAHFTRNQNRVIGLICNDIVEEHLILPSSSGSSSLKTVGCTSRDELFSQLFLENLIDNVADYYITTKTKKARAALTVFDRQLDSVRTQLYGAMSNVASFQDENLNLVRQRPRVEQQQGSLKMQVNSAMYQQLVTAVETAKMTLQKEMPLFEIVDHPILPLTKQRPSIIVWAILGILLGVIATSGWFLARRFYLRMVAAEPAASQSATR